MKYSNYNLEDFLKDDYFIDLILNQDSDALNDIILQNLDKKEEIEKAQSFIKGAKLVDYSVPNKSVKTELWNKINKETIQSKRKAKTFRLNAWWAVAATFILLSSSIWYFNFSKTPSTLITSNRIAKKVETLSQQRKQVTLPDGSIVTLNANSSVKVSDHWDEDHTREVWLEGEAFFEVVKKPNTGAAKFVVHTSEINVEVLGTAFNVKARRGATEVVLQSGKVKLKKENTPSFQEIVMVPGDRVSISDKLTEPVKNQNIKTEKIISWTNGKIIFEDAPLSDVAKAIEDHFGYQVAIQEDELKTELYSGELLTDTPDLFFKILSKIMNVNVSIEGKQMKISKR
jgi:transmembrane sensor